MIQFETAGHLFNFRVAGLLFQSGRVLIHRTLRDDFYAFPGGRVEAGEDTATTVVREFQEELGLDVEVVRLLWVSENFFTHEGYATHELGFYYLLKAREESAVPTADLFYGTEPGADGKPYLEFRWVAVDRIRDEVLYPLFVRDRLGDLPTTVEHVVVREG